MTSAAQPVIPLADAPGSRESWDRPVWQVYLWSLVEAILISNPLQPSSTVRAVVLRLFGARIGTGVILRPRLRVRFPWKLRIGDNSWIGEDVWLHNQDQLSIGHDCVISQGTFITTGSHRHATDMALVTSPVKVEDGAWITARCVVLRGAEVGQSALILPSTVVRGRVPDGTMFGGNPGGVVGLRFRNET
jgi:putative colanic acid biosynthesis acetyltransferase WcaF